MKKEHETLNIEKCIKEPIQENTLKLCNHINRYALSIDSLGISDRDIVLDCSCGRGYGTLFLASKARIAIGVDNDDVYIQEAKQLYKKDNLDFMTYNQLEDTSSVADYIVCIETLEHIDKNEIDNFLDSIYAHLKEGGSMFISTPIGNDGPSTYNKFHLNEMSVATLDSIFSPRFREMLFGMYDYVNSFGKKERYAKIVLKGYKRKEL